MSDSILAAVMPAPRLPVEIREYPRPDLPPGSALLRTARSEVCGTDVHLWHGRLTGVPYPIIPGHVSVGVLEKISFTGAAGVIEFDKRHDPVWGPGKSTGIAVQWQDGKKVPFWPPQVPGMKPFKMPAH